MPLTDPILFLCEGDAETAKSFSGSSRALVTNLRAQGHDVRTVDIASYGIGEFLSKVVTIAPTRLHWAARHHYGPVGRLLRSANARRACSAHPRGAPIIQIGATFDAAPPPDTPLFFYCDANAAQGARGGIYSSVTSLSRRELQAMLAREQRVYDRAWGIFTISECLRQSFIRDFHMPPERVLTVHAGSNLQRAPTAEAVAGARKADEPTILFIGRRFERKGGPTLLRAFAKVREKLPTARLIIAGTTLDLPPMPGVSVVGYVHPDSTGPNSLNALYEEAHLFCMPSHYEPFGIVFVEAMLHGVPCIATDQWAMPEIVDEGETGWLVPVGDVDALASRLIDALSDRARLRTMGQLARERASARFDWRRTVSLMREFMARATAPGPVPSTRVDRMKGSAMVAG